MRRRIRLTGGGGSLSCIWRALSFFCPLLSSSYVMEMYVYLSVFASPCFAMHGCILSSAHHPSSIHLTRAILSSDIYRLPASCMYMSIRCRYFLLCNQCMYLYSLLRVSHRLLYIWMFTCDVRRRLYSVPEKHNIIRK